MKSALTKNQPSTNEGGPQGAFQPVVGRGSRARAESDQAERGLRRSARRTRKAGSRSANRKSGSYQQSESIEENNSFAESNEGEMIERESSENHPYK